MARVRSGDRNFPAGTGDGRFGAGGRGCFVVSHVLPLLGCRRAHDGVPRPPHTRSDLWKTGSGAPRRAPDTGSMGGCCDPKSYAATIGDGYGSQLGRRFRKRGLDPARLRLVDFLTDRGIQGASVLEIGGGVGELHVELLRRGAARATNLEISRGYETEA